MSPRLRRLQAAPLVALAACGTSASVGVPATRPTPGVPLAPEAPPSPPDSSGRVEPMPSASHPGYVHGPLSWFAMPGGGVCPRTGERAKRAPAAEFRDCAYFQGCEPRVKSRPVEKCSPDLDIVTIRDLRAEGGTRAEGSAIAVRGALTLMPLLERGEGLPLCHPRKWHAMLSSPEATRCVSAVLDIDVVPSPFTCMGDSSDLCCRANPNLPPLGADTVVVGRYRGLGNTQHADIDLLWIDRFCEPPPTPVVNVK